MIGRPEPGIRLGALVPRMGEMGITITRAVPGHVVAEVGMDGNANHLGPCTPAPCSASRRCSPG